MSAGPLLLPVLPTEAPVNPLANRGRMAQFMVGTFYGPARYVAFQTVLLLFASGRVYMGGELLHATRRFVFAGRDRAEYQMRILTARGHS